VLDTVLCTDFKNRKDYYKSMLILAQLCQDDENYASMCAIIQALNSDYITRLTYTQRASRKDADHDLEILFEKPYQLLRESPQDLNTGARLYPLSNLRDDLQYLFIAASEDEDENVSWRACQQLFMKLLSIARQASDLCLPNYTDASELLSMQVEKASKEQASIAERAEALAAIDAKQYRAWIKKADF